MKRRKKGFTLAELLIVVAIIAILVAVAIPTFSSSLDKAKQATDAANERNLQAVASILQLTGEVECGGVTVTLPKPEEVVGEEQITYYYSTGGALLPHEWPVPDNAYRAQADSDGSLSGVHTKGACLILYISYSKMQDGRIVRECVVAWV